MKKKETTLDKKEIENVAKEILKKNKPEELLSRLDDQILEYVDDNWEEDGEYESEYDWYIDYGKGEAEDDVITDVIREYECKHKLEFDVDTFVAIGEYIAGKTGIEY